MARVLLSLYANNASEKLGALVAQLGAVEVIKKLQNSNENIEVIKKLQNIDLSKAYADVITRTSDSKSQILTPSSPYWPKKLMDLDFVMPLCLWVLGDPEILNLSEDSVAVVGARAATNYGERMASDIGSTLGQWGIPVISGAAYGIDAAAHRGALAAGGITFAILACGIDIAYPSAHSSLIQKISETGIVATERPPGTPPLKQNFLTRNRIIAALSTQVVVVEAALRSGSLSTANWANVIGRKVWGVPGPITSATSAGVHLGIRNQNMEILLESDDLVLNHFP